MAELGAVASVVQLADVSLRMSGEICKFLDAYKHADRDAKSLRDTLSEVEANVRSLRKYVMDFRKSINAIDEYENLSETVVSALKGYDMDILAAKQLLPPKLIEKPTKRINWALKKNRKTEEVMQRISRRNSNLTTALQILGRQHSLRIREDTQNILAKQAASDVLISKSLAAIESNVQKHDENYAAFISHSKTIIQENRIQQTHSDQQCRTHVSLTSQQARRTNRRLKHIEESTLQIAHNTKQSRTELQWAANQMKHNIETMAAKLEGIHTKTDFVASSVDIIPRIIHEEIRTTLTLLVEQALDRAELRREREMQRLKSFNDTITRDIGSDIQNQKIRRMSYSDQTHPEHPGDFYPNGYNWTSRQEQGGYNIMHAQIIKQHVSEFHYTANTYKRRWSYRCSFGSLEVVVTHIHNRINGSPRSKSYVSVQIYLLPKQGFLGLPGIYVSYSTAPTPKGYYQLLPMVSTISVLDYDHPVYSVIKSGNLATLQTMLATGEVHLRNLSCRGQTLLHVASTTGNLDMCHFLRAQGLSWYDTAVGVGVTPLDALFFYTLSSCESTEIRQKILKFLGNTEYETNKAYPFLGVFAHDAYYDTPEQVSIRAETYQEMRKLWPSVLDDIIVQHGSLVCSPFTMCKSNIVKELDMLLENGLKLNAVSIHGHVSLKALICRLLCCYKIKEETNTWSAVQPAQLQLPENPSCLKAYEEFFQWNGRTEVKNGITLMALFMVRGADVHYIESREFDDVQRWSDLMTDCRLARLLGVFHEWRLALYWSGLDPDQVFLEDERQQKQAFRLRGATRSGIDEAVLAPPLIDGLRCRRCRRRYCNNHGLYVFKKSPEMTPFFPA